MKPMAEKAEKKPRAKRPSVRDLLTRHNLTAAKLEIGLVKLAALVKQHDRIARLIEARNKAQELAATRKAAYNEAADAAEIAEEQVLVAYRKLDEIAGDEDTKAMPLFEDKLKAKAPPVPPADGDDSWKAVKLADLKDPAIPKRVLRRLERAGIWTLGQLSQAREPISRTVKGIGEVAQAKVEAAVAAQVALAYDSQGGIAGTEDRPRHGAGPRPLGLGFLVFGQGEGGHFEHAEVYGQRLVGDVLDFYLDPQAQSLRDKAIRLEPRPKAARRLRPRRLTGDVGEDGVNLAARSALDDLAEGFKPRYKRRTPPHRLTHRRTPLGPDRQSIAGTLQAGKLSVVIVLVRHDLGPREEAVGRQVVEQPLGLGLVDTRSRHLGRREDRASILLFLHADEF